MFADEFIILVSIFFALFFGIFFIKKILDYPSGNEKMNEIAKTIQSCAKTYLSIQ